VQSFLAAENLIRNHALLVEIQVCSKFASLSHHSQQHRLATCLRSGLSTRSHKWLGARQSGLAFVLSTLIIVNILAGTTTYRKPTMQWPTNTSSPMIRPSLLHTPSSNPFPSSTLQLHEALGCSNWILTSILHISLLHHWLKNPKIKTHPVNSQTPWAWPHHRDTTSGSSSQKSPAHHRTVSLQHSVRKVRYVYHGSSVPYGAVRIYWPRCSAVPALGTVLVCTMIPLLPSLPK
jgi:Fungal specific transcription factor domain